MFLLADINVEVMLWISYLTISNTNVSFSDQELIRRSYTTAKALFSIKRVELIDKKKFAKTALDEKIETFVIYVTSLSLSLLKWR